MRIEIDNFVFIDEATVELDRGFTIVTGQNADSTGNISNGSGKTLFLEAIYWCIWGVSLRGAKMETLIGPFRDECRVRVEIPEIGLGVERKRKGAKTTITVLDLIAQEELTFQKNTQAQEYIDSKMGATQNEANLLAYSGEYTTHVLDLTPALRREQLTKLLKYNEDAHSQLKDKIRTVENSLLSRPDNINRLISSNEQSLQREEDRYTNSVKQLDQSLSEAEFRYSTAQYNRQQIENSLNSFKASSKAELMELILTAQDNKAVYLEELNQMKSQHKDLQNSISNIQNQIDTATSSADSAAIQEQQSVRETIQTFRSTLSTELSQYKEAISQKQSNLQSLESRISTLQIKIENNEEAISTIEAQIEELENNKASLEESISNESCPTCGQGIGDLDTNNPIVAEISKLIGKIYDSKQSLIQRQEEVSTWQSEVEDTNATIANVSNELNTITEDRDEAIESFKAEWLNILNNLETLYSITEEGVTISADSFNSGTAAEMVISVCSSIISSRARASVADSISHLEEQINTLEQNLDQLTNGISLKAVQVEAEDRQISTLRAATELFDKAEVVRGEERDAKASLEALRGQVAVQKVDLKSQYEDEKKRLEDENTSLRQELEQVQSQIPSVQFVKQLLADYKNKTVATFLGLFESRLNKFLTDIGSDIQCQIDFELDGSSGIEFLFTDQSKEGQFYEYHLASRGERSRIKKIFSQAMVEIFNPSFVLSDESYDGIDESGVAQVSRFIMDSNEGRYFIEATPLDLSISESSKIANVVCRKEGGKISITQV